MIHQTAIISPSAQIPDNVTIGAYSIVEDNVIIGAHTKIEPHAVIKANTVLGAHVSVHSFAVIGDLPQTYDFDTSLVSGVQIGANSIIREGVTIHRSTQSNANTIVGESCFLMVNSHVAHDCVLGDHVRLTNGVLLGGHVTIGDHANLGGNAVVHQNLNLGEGVMIAGRAGLNLDIPPFLLVSERNCVHGLNLIGLKRRGYKLSDIAQLKSCYRQVLCTPGNPYELATSMMDDPSIDSHPSQAFLKFFKTKGSKGCVHFKHIQHA